MSLLVLFKDQMFPKIMGYILSSLLKMKFITFYNIAQDTFVIINRVRRGIPETTERTEKLEMM